MLSQCIEARLIGAQDIDELIFIKYADVNDVARNFDDHFVDTNSRRGPIDASIGFAPPTVIFKRGIFVGNGAHKPAGRVFHALRFPLRIDFGRRHVFIAFTERTLEGIRELSLTVVVPRPLGAIGCDDDAPAGDGILSKFRHAKAQGQSPS